MKPKPKRQPPATDDKQGELRDLVMAQTEAGQCGRSCLHQMIGGGVYLNQIAAEASSAFSESDRELIRATAMDYAADVVERMNPRDPLEEMLVMQALWTHGRAAHLSMLANMQSSIETSKQINDSADKASNTYRRLMLALAEYRRPLRAGDSFTAIMQANIAGQRVLHNAESPKSQNKNVTNEQGLNNDTTDESPKALPADPGRVELPAPGRPAHETVAEQHGAEDARGQGSLEAERSQARRAFRRSDRRPAGDYGDAAWTARRWRDDR